ncbi:MAG TPA: 2Fe-2S iron-sulfur cluster-binding protein [bacterium]|nr:2Fe-2S iron-sulfur cluster-binding protein [bacterium]
MIFHVKRFDPEADARPSWQAHTVDVRPKMSVLDGLFWILERMDGTLGFRYSCRAGMCGSCAMVVNGREALACRLRLERISGPVYVEPLRSLPVIKDLVVDMAPFFTKYRSVDPFYIGEDPSMTGRIAEPVVVRPDSGVRDVVDQQVGCISCGACYSACPVVALNPGYLGPAALNRAYVLKADVREPSSDDRLALVSGDDGVFACHDVGSCITACPVGVNPLLSIHLLRKGAPHR